MKVGVLKEAGGAEHRVALVPESVGRMAPDGISVIIEAGAWTNMSIEHTARTGADKGYVMVIAEDCCSTMNADWHRASIDYAMQNVALVTKADEVIAALG